MPGLTAVPCTDVASVMQLLERANSNRSTAGTKCNERCRTPLPVFSRSRRQYAEGRGLLGFGDLQMHSKGGDLVKAPFQLKAPLHGC